MSDFAFFHVVVIIAALYSTVIAAFISLTVKYFSESTWKIVASVILVVYISFLFIYYVADKLGADHEFSNAYTVVQLMLEGKGH